MDAYISSPNSFHWPFELTLIQQDAEVGLLTSHCENCSQVSATASKQNAYTKNKFIMELIWIFFFFFGKAKIVGLNTY
ncbi:hypothetical protein EUGRSUZ_H03070 [Eucalyptus grandis]|uniref:Uncharacterized protein n=2 Tax=Eucalyptus grandis TaxID=71139 RepID=A0A059B2J9_EUCGR|nr:hypothetical protein EUGRSUZ_H03070 [Eucalyptus grandis]